MYAFPVLNHHPRTGELLQVRWNNDDRAAFTAEDLGGIGAEIWYEAAEKWVEILRRPDGEYWEQLRPGGPLSKLQSWGIRTFEERIIDCGTLVFDNWRVLHGRSTFTGKRRMCGGYSEFSLSLSTDPPVNLMVLTHASSQQRRFHVPMAYDNARS